ncbi:dihydropteroate synthase [Stenoxybacter acetivorans]|uniref:dihydropteroate synthase n=1 Tax=Stenoxybacter acetivorans TaxID=422441 RepID=UPI000559CE89|nr:dihydropteroate synthase [Stenoxybacter acetivorans]
MTSDQIRQTPIWQCGRFRIALNRPQIMGIINITPDSFSDGGQYSGSISAALAHAAQLLKDGADILDIGGESSRPGAPYVSPEEEWARVSPILKELTGWQVPITLDTRRTWVMRQALEQGGTDGINDIAALSDEGAVSLLTQDKTTGVCLMHMQGLPENMQDNPQYGDVVTEVGHYLRERVAVCTAAGIDKQRLVIDPGFGFGKTREHHRALMLRFAEWQRMADCPALIGVSRKSMIGAITGETQPQARMVGSVVAAVAAAARGAAIVRVHDVRETRQGLQVWQELGGFLA